MKLTLGNGTVMDVADVEESFFPRNTQGVVLSIRMDSAEGIEALRGTFVPEALETVTVGEGEGAKTISGYTRVDSIRKFYSTEMGYDTAVDLVKES